MIIVRQNNARTKDYTYISLQDKNKYDFHDKKIMVVSKKKNDDSF